MRPIAGCKALLLTCIVLTAIMATASNGPAQVTELPQVDLIQVPCDPKAITVLPLAGSADGNLVLISQLTGDTGYQLYVSDLRNGKVQRLTSEGAFSEVFAAVFDPNGSTTTYVAVSKEPGKRDWRTEVSRVSLDGTNRELVVPLENGTEVLGMAWSPKGTKLAVLQATPNVNEGYAKLSLWDGEVLKDCVTIPTPQLSVYVQMVKVAWLSEDVVLLGCMALKYPSEQKFPDTAWLVADVRSLPAKTYCLRRDPAPCYRAALSPDSRWLACSFATGRDISAGGTRIVSLYDGSETRLDPKGPVISAGPWLGQPPNLRLLVSRLVEEDTANEEQDRPYDPDRILSRHPGRSLVFVMSYDAWNKPPASGDDKASAK